VRSVRHTFSPRVPILIDFPLHPLVHCSKSRFIPLADLASGSTDKVPAALNLPPGKLFFGWTYKPFQPESSDASSSSSLAAAPPVRLCISPLRRAGPDRRMSSPPAASLLPSLASAAAPPSPDVHRARSRPRSRWPLQRRPLGHPRPRVRQARRRRYRSNIRPGQPLSQTQPSPRTHGPNSLAAAATRSAGRARAGRAERRAPAPGMRPAAVGRPVFGYLYMPVLMLAAGCL
jgi:hypothetical protein